MGKTVRLNSTTKGSTIPSGALLANTQVIITHNLGLTNYQLESSDSDNNCNVKTLKKDPSDPKNKVIVEVDADLPAGVDISIIGYD